MTETEKSHSTTAFNRRAALPGGAALTSLAAVPSAAASNPSPEYTAVMRTYRAWCDYPPNPYRNSDDELPELPECEAYRQEGIALFQTHERALKALTDRPVRSWGDVADLGRAWIDFCWETSATGTPIKRRARCDEVELALAGALVKMGGLDV